MTQLKYLLDETRESHAEQLGHVPCTNVEDVERLDEKSLSNGDVYVGTFKGILPHGKGKYAWSDGTVYDGDWDEGKMTGKGQISWPSGAKYEGDFSGGYLHGFGMLIAPDGSIYRGTWRMNIRHGFGRKEYCNLDFYEGSWREGVHEGSGKYSWSNGNSYIGIWKCGRMHGRGVMKWANGDLYDGFWFNGLRHGSGIYRFADGGYYFGTWTRGLKDGRGTFYPAGSRHPTVKKWHATLAFDDTGKGMLRPSLSSGRAGVNRSLSEKISFGGSFRSSGRISHRTTLSDANSNLSDVAREFINYDSSFTASRASEDGQSEVQDCDTVVYEREYVQGVCMKEILRNSSDLSQKKKLQNKFHAPEAKKSSCVGIFRGNYSYYLMLNLQLGIRYTVGKITPVPSRDVRPSDFGDQARITMFFPRKGSQFTPPHKSIDFYWKDYCPMVFRDLRELFKLDAAEYMMSICGDDGLRELSSPGKSGSLFYLSHDDKFVIKTLKKTELKALLKMLHSYHTHVQLHENTLITKFFGLHRITIKGRRKVRFVVMGNMFCTELRIHRRYDLKGSTQGRFTSQEKIRENSTLKDLDLAYEFHVDKLLREFLFRQLSLDSHFLEAQGIIDYSLLLGVHFIAPNQLNGLVKPPDAMPHHENAPDGCGVTPEGERIIPPKGLRLVAHEPSFFNAAPGPHIRGSTMRLRSLGDKEVDLLLPSCERLRVQLGVNMPALANRKVDNGEEESAEVELFEVYDVVLYMGIIDILQEYNVRKRVEHACKSVKFDPGAISVVDPQLYAKRFISFLRRKVFPETLPSPS